MTVAAFLAVAASSYAAVTVGNKGYEATIKKDGTSVSIEVVLKKGTYAITATEGNVAVTSPDGKTAYPDPNAVIIGDKGATVKITVTTDAQAADKKVTIKIEPKAQEWKDLIQSYQNKINELVTEVSKLPDDPNNVNYAKRAALLDKISQLQSVVDNAGIEEYNTFVDTGKVPSIEGGDNGLDNLTDKVSNASANEAAYNAAIAAHGALDASALDEANTTAQSRTDIDAATKAAAKALYDTTKNNIVQFKKDAEEAYKAGTAGVLFANDKIADRIKNLNAEIAEATKKITDGNNLDMTYAAVKAAIEGATTNYNTVVDKLYNQLEDEGIPAGLGKDIYDDQYKEAISKLKPYLDKITEVDTKNEENYAAKKASDISGDLPTFAEMDVVYDKYYNKIGDKDNPANGTLRKYYKDAKAQLDGYTAYVASLTADAVKDTDTDKDKKVIKDYYAGKVTEINKIIAGIQTKLDAANKAHTVDQFNVSTEAAAKGGYNEAKTALLADLEEYTAFVDSRSRINAVMDELARVQAQVEKRKSADGKFVAATRYTTRYTTISNGIQNLEAGNRANYTVTATDKKTAQTYSSTVYSSVSAFYNEIDGYDTNTQTAFNNYNTIADAIAAFNLEITGGKDGDTNVASWASKVLNENVTIDGTLEAQTYGQAREEQQDIVAAAQAAVDAALAVATDKEAEFGSKLATAAGKKGSVYDAKALIQTYKNTYADNVAPWQTATDAQAKVDAVKESKDRADAVKANIAKIADYNADDYGTKAAQVLNAEKQAIADKIGDYATATAKADGNIAERIKDADGKEANAAIALIDQVRQDLVKINNELDAHKAKAAAAKTAFGGYKTLYAEVDELLNGKTGGKKSVKGLLAPADESFLDAEITAQQGLLDAVKTDVNAAEDVAKARQDQTVDKKTVKGIDSRLADIKTAVEDLRVKAQNEAANEQAKRDFDEKINAYRVVNNAPVSVAKIFTDTEDAIKKSEDKETTYAQTTLGEQYFLNLLDAYQNETDTKKVSAEKPSLAWINNLVTKYYGTKIKKDKADTKFTDPDNNLAKKKAEVLALLNTLIANVEALPVASVANEKAYVAETKAYNEAKEAYEALFVEVNKAKDSGDSFKAAYEAAIDQLTAINTQLKEYRNGSDTKDSYETAYAKGGSVAFDGQLATINGIKDALTKLKQTWNAGDDADGSYKKAVADDNAARKDAFDKAFTQLYDAYYGKMVGTTKIDGAVDIVTKLSKLDYADQVSEDIKGIVTGDNSLYTYADKIAKLQSDAQAAYDKVTAPDFFDEAEQWKQDAEKMKQEVLEKEKAYADAVNGIIKADFKKKKDDLSNLITQFIYRSQKSLGIDNKKATELLAEAKNADNKNPQQILDEATIAKDQNDLAYQYQYYFSSALDEGYELTYEVYYNAIIDSWNANFGAIDMDAEKDAIAGFYGSGNLSDNVNDYQEGHFTNDYESEENEDDQVDRLKEKESLWNVELNKFANKVRPYHYPDAVTNLENLALAYEYSHKPSLYTEIASMNLGTDKEPNVQIHTNVYWQAYDENEKYNQLVKDNAELIALKEALNNQLDAAVADYKNLLVEHDTKLKSEASTIEGNIGNLKTSDLAGGTGEKNIKTQIETLTGKAILKEYEAIAIEVGELAKTYGSNDAFDSFVKSNETIYNNFVDGKKNEKGEYILDKGKKVKATVAETYEAYAQLEKAIGEKKLAIDEASQTAAADVAAAFDEAQKAYAALGTQLEGTAEEVQAYYADEMDGIAADIAKTGEKIDNQGSAVALEKDNNLEAIDNIMQSINQTSNYIDDAQAPFTARAEKIVADTEKLNALAERLQSVNSTAAEYVHQYIIYEHVDGVETSYNYRERHNEEITDYIATTQELVDAQPANSILDPNYHWRWSYDKKINEISNRISAAEKDITDLEKLLAKTDANGYIDDAWDAYDIVNTKLNEVLYDGDKKTELQSALETLMTTSNKINSYNWSAYFDGEVQYDIAGNLINEDGSSVPVDYMNEAYPAVLEAIAAVQQGIADIDAQIITPGAINDPYGDVTSEDIAAICNLILGITNPEDLTEAQQIAADVDDDSRYTVADLTKIQNIYLYGNPNGYQVVNAFKARVRGVVGSTPGALTMNLGKSQIGVELSTAVNYAAIQMDVKLPAGVALTDAAFAGNEDVAVAAINQIGKNTWRVLLYGAQNATISANDALLNLSIAGEGTGAVIIENVAGATAKSKLYSIPGISGEYDIATGIDAPETAAAEGDGTIFGANGVVRRGLEKGLNIIKTTGGKVKKIFVK